MTECRIAGSVSRLQTPHRLGLGSADPNTWDLAYVGMDLETDLPADAIPYSRLYEGCGIQCAGLPLALVVEGVRLQFASSAPFFHLTRNVFDVSDHSPWRR